MKKRALALLLVLCMALTLVPGVAAAATARLPEPPAAPAALGAEPVRPTAGAYSITMTYSGPGVAELYADSANAGDLVYLLADPEPGYELDYSNSGYYYKEHELVWYYIGDNMYMIKMPDGDVKLDLRFVPIETDSHNVTLNITDGGSVTVDQKTAKKGESIFIHVVTAPGYSLESVKGKSASGWNEGYYHGKEGDGDRYEILMPDEDMEIQVTFKRNGPYAITAYVDSDPAGGTVSLSHETAYELEPITVTAIPDEGFQVTSVSCYHSKVSKVSENVYTFSMPKFKEEVHVYFEAITYPVTVEMETIYGGTAHLDTEGAVFGQIVTLICQPQEGYRIARITGVEELTDNGDNTFTFTMPSHPVELKVLYLRQNNPFLDVTEGRFYHDSVLWAVENGITNGLTADSFGPDASCTRGQVVTFLWRALGEPEPTITEHPFTDVAEGAYYYQAMLWALENGVTSGMTADTFAPNAPCTRGQVVTFLWRAYGKTEPTVTEHPFTDVKEGAFYYKAMLWAVENGVTSGTSAAAFSPDGICTRGQVVTFLYRADQIPEPEPEPEPLPDLT